MSPIAIACRNLVKRFPHETRPAVNGVNLEVATGELIVLLGPSGCGKTTLLKMINRLIEPSSGEIWVAGQDVRTLPVHSLRRQIGYVIQQVGLFPHMRIEENIATVPQLLGWQRARTDARIDDLLGMVGLPLSYRRKYPRQLSGGEQQRIGLARALAADPEIMLMDEPFAAIDAITRACLQEELLGIQRQLHKTILFVTHDVEEALRLADRIAVLREGQVVQFGTPLEILVRPADPFVRELTGGGDVLRRMSVLDVHDLLLAQEQASPGPYRPSPMEDTPEVRLEDDLRTALARLLESQAPALTVLDAHGQPLRRIAFDDLRWLLSAQWTEGVRS